MAEERVERRLAAILCADVVGYSRLMGTDEEQTLAVQGGASAVGARALRRGGGREFLPQALGCARRQSALSWELRAVVSLAQLWRDQGRSTEATALLQSVYDRFTSPKASTRST